MFFFFSVLVSPLAFVVRAVQRQASVRGDPHDSLPGGTVPLLLRRHGGTVLPTDHAALGHLRGRRDAQVYTLKTPQLVQMTILIIYSDRSRSRSSTRTYHDLDHLLGQIMI